jgi:uncharacterized protein (TIGR02147 family)
MFMEAALPLTTAVKVPVVCVYVSYRVVMKDSYLAKRTTHAGFSFRRFSQMIGLKSPNFLQMVIQGKRNLSNDLAPAVGKVLCKTAAERNYFTALVKREHARCAKEKEEANQQLMVAIRRIRTREIPREKDAILTHWYYMVIREMAMLPDFKPCGDWISTKLRNLINPAQAEEGLRVLLKCGYLKYSGLRYETVDPIIDTGDSMLSERLLEGHLSVFQAWSKILTAIEPSERELGFLNIPISKDKIPEFKDRIRRFQDEIIGWLHTETEPDQIVQFGTYLVPVTQ